MIDFLTSPAFVALQFSLLAVFLVDNAMLAPSWSRAVRGSHQRYVYASIRTVTCWSGLAFWVACMFNNIAEQQHVWTAIDIAFAAWEYRNARKFLASDDDNWFKRTGRRLKAWAQNLGQAPLPVGV